MTREEMVERAAAAGYSIDEDYIVNDREGNEVGLTEALADFAMAQVEAAVEEQRESDAKIAERHFIPGHSVAGLGFAKMCADKIRTKERT